MNIVIVGTGYVGLVTGVGFAEQGHNVSFIDLDSNKIQKLEDKQLPFFEPDLDNYFEKDENFPCKSVNNTPPWTVHFRFTRLVTAISVCYYTYSFHDRT